MKTLEEKMGELKAKHENEVLLQEQELAVLSALPQRPGVDPEVDWRVFMSKLYGRVASATRRTGDYETRYKNALPWSVEDLRRCIEALPPMPMAHLRYTFTTFSQLPLCDELAKKMSESSISKLTELSIPLYIRMKPGSEAELVWFTKIEHVGVIEVKYPIPWQYKWMKHDWRRVNYHGGFRYEGSGSWLDISLPFGGEWVNWGRGSDEYMGETTKYWTRPEFTLTQLLNAIEDAQEQ